MTTVDDLTRVVLDGADSEDNRWYAGIALGHDPSRLEALAHFLAHGGYEWACKLCGIDPQRRGHYSPRTS